MEQMHFFTATVCSNQNAFIDKSEVYDNSDEKLRLSHKVSPLNKSISLLWGVCVHTHKHKEEGKMTQGKDESIFLNVS